MKPPRLLALVALCLALPFPRPAAATDLRSIQQMYSIDRAKDVRIELTAGDIRVETVPGHKLRVDVKVKCSGFAGDCDDRARDVEVVGGYEGDTFVLRVEGMRKKNNFGLSLNGTIQIPRDLAIDVDMGAGDLSLYGLERDADVSLGAGDLGLHMSEQMARSVDMHVGLGDATLRRVHDREDGRGFLGKTLSWRGSGPADIRLNLGLGDVVATLEE